MAARMLISSALKKVFSLSQKLDWGTEVLSAFAIPLLPLVPAYLNSVLNFSFQTSFHLGRISAAYPKSNLMYVGVILP